jgi:putative ABC transport system permease protein
VNFLLVGVNPADPATLAGAAAFLLIVSAAATCFPALRATRVDPIAALRRE